MKVEITLSFLIPYFLFLILCPRRLTAFVTYHEAAAGLAAHRHFEPRSRDLHHED